MSAPETFTHHYPDSEFKLRHANYVREDIHEALTARLAEAERQRDGYRHHLHECEQIAGKALGYPWFKDDQKNFPAATEADGVCIGEHVGDTIVAELATRLAEVEREAEKLANGLLEAEGGRIRAETALSSALAENERMKAALRNIAEGNLGDAAWQANYDRIRAVAFVALGVSNDV